MSEAKFSVNFAKPTDQWKGVVSPQSLRTKVERGGFTSNPADQSGKVWFHIDLEFTMNSYKFSIIFA
jgi:hypothetical protein